MSQKCPASHLQTCQRLLPGCDFFGRAIRFFGSFWSFLEVLAGFGLVDVFSTFCLFQKQSFSPLQTCQRWLPSCDIFARAIRFFGSFWSFGDFFSRFWSFLDVFRH